MSARAHVVGAGLAGLAAAVELAGEGRRVTLYDSAQQAGGRCRSFLDAELGVRIDNGNHLLLSGNTAASRYVDRIGGRDTFLPPGEAAIPFVDLADGARWTVRPNAGPLPWWLFSAARRVPGTRAQDYFDVLKLWRAGSEATVAGVLGAGSVLYRRLWQPLAVAALNTAAEDGAARLLWRILYETLGKGAAACRPLLPREGLSESLVEPALAYLRAHGGEVRFGARLKALDLAGERVGGLMFDEGLVRVGPQDGVVLAVPAAIAARLVPGLTVPDDYAPIVNAHYRYAAPDSSPEFVGVVGGTAEWVFRKRQVLSVTVSAADSLAERPAEELAEALWRDVARVYGLPLAPVPASRVVKERRATFRATPAQLKRRPSAATDWPNLHLAGDYVDTGLPATIEGAIRSGFAAAARVRRQVLPAPALISGTVPAAPSPTPMQDRQRALP